MAAMPPEGFVSRNLPDGSVEIDMGPAPAGGAGIEGLGYGYENLGSVSHEQNLAEVLDPTTLSRLADDVIRRTEDEIDSRKRWEEMTKRGLQLLGLGEADDLEKDMPEGVQTTGTLLMAAVQRWAGNMITECVPTDGPVRVKKKDPKDPDDERVERVERFFNCYLLDYAPGWQEDQDRTINNVARIGCSFKKISSDPSRGMRSVVIDQIDPENFITGFGSKALGTGQPVTHRISLRTRELRRLMDSGIYLDSVVEPFVSGPDEGVVEQARRDMAGLSITDADEEEIHILYERHLYASFEDDPHPRGAERPYVVTVHERSQQVLGVYRNWDPGDPTEYPASFFSGYQFMLGESGVYGIGLAALLRMAAMAVKTALNEALIAAHFANKPSGFKAASFNIRGDTTVVPRGEFIDVESPQGDVSKAFAPLPFKGADASLVSLMEKLDSDGRELAGMLSMNIAESSSTTPMGTILAAMDEASIVPASSNRRFYRGFAQELKLIQAAAARSWGHTQVQLPSGEMLLPGDLDAVLLEPAMRPGELSNTRRIMVAQAILQEAKEQNSVYDVRVANVRYLTALGADNIDELLPEPEEAQPSDPVTEERYALTGKPMKAGITQHHEAHIQAHSASRARLGADESLGDKGVQAVGNLLAHEVEHHALLLAVQVASGLGIPLQEFEKGLPPEVEYQIAPAIAQIMQALAEQKTGGMSDSELKIRIEEIRAQSRREVAEINAQAKLAATAMTTHTQKALDRSETSRSVAKQSMTYRIASEKNQHQTRQALLKPPPGQQTGGDKPKPSPRPGG